LLKQKMDLMLGCPVYVDTQGFVDSGELLSTVAASEVLLLVLTRRLLTRPWYPWRPRTATNHQRSASFADMAPRERRGRTLLEIRQAISQQKPIVLLDLSGGESLPMRSCLGCPC
jgi:hypothetical protein